MRSHGAAGRGVGRLLLVVGLLASNVRVGAAQDAETWPGQVMSLATLARYKVVQDELQLNASQLPAIQDFTNDVLNAARATGPDGLPLNLGSTPAERRGQLELFFSSSVAKEKALDERFRSRLSAVLKPEQMQRLQEVAWQVAAPFALQDSRIATSIGLTTAQRERIARILSEYRKSVIGTMGELTYENAKAGVAKLREADRKRDLAIGAILAATQKRAFEKALGKKFDVTQVVGRIKDAKGQPTEKTK